MEKFREMRGEMRGRNLAREEKRDSRGA